jgi:hypothetical protein
MVKYQDYAVTAPSIFTKSIILRRVLGGFHSGNCSDFGHGISPKRNLFRVASGLNFARFPLASVPAAMLRIRTPETSQGRR